MRPWVAAIVISIMAVLACLTAGLLLGGDPLLPAELAGAAVIAIWLAEVLAVTTRAHLLGQAVEAVSREAVVAGVPCRVIDEGGSHAFVLGPVRPRIFIGAGLLTRLDVDELRAVMLHEEHHRRSRAPLRTAALGAWRHLARPSSRARHAIDTRLAQLEVDADRFALRHGAHREAIAGALLKSGSSALGPGFGAHAQTRVRHLLDPAMNDSSETDQVLPYEWAPVALSLAIILACHIVL